MKKLFVAGLLVLFAAVPALATDTVVLPAKNGDVTFNHKAHSETMACKTCHGEGTPAKIELDKNKAHDLCKGCHKDKGAGPTKCGDCHKR